MSGFAPIRDVAGGEVTLAELRAGEVYLNEKAADELHVRAGDPLLVFAGATPVTHAHPRDRALRRREARPTRRCSCRSPRRSACSASRARSRR